MINNEIDKLVKAFQNKQDFDEKSFYDKVIKPKVKEVYELCKEHNIPAIWHANPRSHGDDLWTQCFVTGNPDRVPLQFLVAHCLISAALTPKLATALEMVLMMMDDIPDPNRNSRKSTKTGVARRAPKKKDLKKTKTRSKTRKEHDL